MSKKKCKLLTSNPIYKPFGYPWAFEAWKQHEQMHWLPEEVPLSEDVRDWQKAVTDAERNLLTQIFRFFTQQDILVGGAYVDHYLKVFQPTEVRMMLQGFAAREAIHVAAYAHLLDTIGIPEVEYSAFMEYAEMKDKFEYTQQFNVKTPRDIAKSLAVFSGFMEGLQLFASFAMLMNFPRFNKMKGMGQVVAWSIRDETLHVENMVKLFRTFIQENYEIWTDEFKKELYDICREMVHHEDKFIDLAFEMGGVEGMTADDIKQYIRFIADKRLLQLGLKPNFGVKTNPLTWLDEMLSAPEHVNFFEQRATEYSRAAMVGTWDDAYAQRLNGESYEVFGQPGCPWCEKACQLLQNYDREYSYIDLSKFKDLKAQMYETTGRSSVPIIYRKTPGAEKVLVGGFTELEKIILT